MYTKTIEPLLAEDRYGSLVLQAIVSSASDYALIKGRASLKPLLGAKKPVIYAMLGDEAEVPEKPMHRFRAPATCRSSARRSVLSAPSPGSQPMAARSKRRKPASGRYR